MPNGRETQETLNRYLKARTPFVSFWTAEQSRGLKLLRDVAQELQVPVRVHTLSQGVRDLVNEQVISDDRSVVSALDLASQEMGRRQNLTYVFTDVQDLQDDSSTSRQFLDTVRLAERTGGSIVVMTDSPVWPRLQKQGMSVVLESPDLDEMGTILRATVDPYRGHLPIEWGDAEFAEAASILVGLEQVQVENVIANLLANGGIRNSDLTSIARSKDQMFSALAGVERVDLKSDFEVGGLEGLSAWLERKRRFLTADLRERQMRPPRGVLLVGVPGCGKSLSAKSIASTWGLSLYRLDLANIQGMYVGQSEARLKEALATADMLAPCVLWIDEIEKGLSGMNDTTGVTTRLVGHFLYWLQESQSRVFVVATANDVSRLPPELLRRGRFDELFFVDLPTADERRDIINIYLKRYLRRPVSSELLDELVRDSEDFAGADLESAVKTVGEEAELVGDESVSDDFIRASFSNVVPLSRTNPEVVDSIRQWGRDRAVPASGRPIAVENGSAISTRRVLISDAK